MSQIRKRAALWAPLLLVLFSAVAYAGIAYSENYARVTRDSGGAYQAHRAHSSTDSSVTDMTPEDPQPTNGDPTIVVAPRFNTAGATVTIFVALYDDDGRGNYTFMEIADIQTATASTEIRESASGDYVVLEPLYFDTLGADVYDVRYIDESAGTVEGWARTLGAKTRAAE